jgi:hypothetical protein
VSPRLVAVEVQQEPRGPDDEVDWELDSGTGLVLRVRKSISSADLASVLTAFSGVTRT